MQTQTLFALFVIGAVVSVDVPLCGKDENIVSLEKQDGSGKAVLATSVAICRDETFLWLNYTAIDPDIIASDTDVCNSPLYLHDVVEAFFGVGNSLPAHYVEVELSPKNQLFVTRVTNPSGNCTAFSGDLVDCVDSGIQHRVTVDHGRQAWNALLGIPFSLIPSNEGQPLMGNLFRIDHSVPKSWSCLQPTLLSPPCFHVPGKFVPFVFV